MRFDFIIPRPWQAYLSQELTLEYMQSLQKFIQLELKSNKIIYPRIQDVFMALELTTFENAKVVILGQDPYHGEGQAHGLAFSVPDNLVLPPSLRNIFHELENDLGIKKPLSGNLESWAKEGVLLLNAVLTVEKNRVGSHQRRGWEKFTDKIIQLLNDKKENLVFILWGSHAQEKAKFVRSDKHLIIKSVHPSPLSSYRGFFGSKPFSLTNNYLKSHGIRPVDWDLSSK